MTKAVVKKEAPWYYGGLASIGAVCFTHPLDTIKVQLQTQQKATFGLFGKNFLFEINQKDLSGI